jgi:hypothetical protein
MKEIFKNQKNRIFSLGIVLVSIISLGIFVQSCDNEYDTDTSKAELSLNLKSSKGYVIAPNISSLKQEISLMITETYGESKIFEIINIIYCDLEQGCIASIQYKTDDGHNGTILKTNISSITYDSDIRIREIKGRKSILKSGNENSARMNGILYTCKDLGSCSCIPTFTTPGDGVNISCGCDSCELSTQF